MKTLPFFQPSQPGTSPAGPAPKPKRYPFHDNEECPVGQEVRQRGQWQYYGPRSTAETRPRCLTCIALDRTEK